MLMLKPAGEIIEQAPSAPGITGRVGLIHRPSHRGSQPLGQRLGDIALFILAVALNQGVRANTSTTALCSALEPSITTNSERSQFSPLSTRSASSARTAEAFSVAPSRSPSTCFLLRPRPPPPAPHARRNAPRRSATRPGKASLA